MSLFELSLIRTYRTYNTRGRTICYLSIKYPIRVCIWKATKIQKYRKCELCRLFLLLWKFANSISIFVYICTYLKIQPVHLIKFKVSWISWESTGMYISYIPGLPYEISVNRCLWIQKGKEKEGGREKKKERERTLLYLTGKSPGKNFTVSLESTVFRRNWIP